jgi:hypothetical protein
MKDERGKKEKEKLRKMLGVKEGIRLKEGEEKKRKKETS